MQTRKYDQPEFDRDCQVIAENIKRSEIKYDMIIALGRGGVPAGSRLSHLTNLPMMEVPYSLKDASRSERFRNLVPQLSGQRLLIVDDISDSGKTLEEIAGYLDGEFFHTATLVFKPQTSHYRPTYLATIHMGDEWIEFFWEEPLIAK